MKTNTKKNMLFGVVLIFSLFCLFSSVALAEGSKELVEFGGYRPYIEWDTINNMVGVPRKNVFYVYAKNGETISFGSSVAKSFDSKDIVVRNPSGVEQIFDVTDDGNGFINTIAKENIGPYPEKGGYTPIVIDVDQTGVWEFEFHSCMNGTVNSVKLLTSAELKLGAREQGRGVAAWDVTVKKADGTPVVGRLFTNYLVMNTGFNSVTKERVVNSKLYVLTKDGYLYNVDLNGLDPYGFMFFANNRGLIDATSNTSLYRTGIADLISTSDKSMLTMQGNVKVPFPNVSDTPLDKTHRIFFNVPASDLPASIPTSAIAPAKINSFKFTGSNVGKTGVGIGGSFCVNVNKATTFEITIDTNGNGVFDEGIDVKIANSAVAGDNMIHWNGNDANGDAVSQGTYTATVTTKGGEYHFPFFDVENNTKGIKIQLLNAPEIPDGFDVNTVYYNNASYTTASGAVVNTSPSGNGAIKPVSALGGFDSSLGAFAFDSIYGDNKAIDLWTYYPGNKATTQLEIEEDVPLFSSVSGYVFFDKNKDGVFDSGEYPLSGVNVKVIDSNNDSYNLVTNSTGNYSVNIAQGSYTIQVSDPSGYTLTTNNSVQTGEAGAVVYAKDVGYYAAMDVSIALSENKQQVNEGDEIEFTLTVSNDSRIDAIDVNVYAALPANTKHVSDNSNGSFDSETGEWKIGDLESGESMTIKIVAKVVGAGEYTYVAVVSAFEDTYADNNRASVTYNSIGLPAPDPQQTEFTVNKNTEYSAVTTTSDSESSKITYSVLVPATNGVASVNSETGEWVYTPNTDYVGVDKFIVLATNAYGKTAKITVNATVVEVPASDSDKVQGILTSYYDCTDVEFESSLRYKQIEKMIAMNNGYESPEPTQIYKQTFGAKYEGYIKVPKTGNYRFKTYSDDGVRVIINDTVVIDRWTLIDLDYTVATNTIYLEEGQYYPISVDYYQSPIFSAVYLFWEAEGVPMQLVPSSAYYVSKSIYDEYIERKLINPLEMNGSGLKATYCNLNDDNELDMSTATDAEVMNSDLWRCWGGGTPEGISSDKFGAVFEGYIEGKFTEEMTLDFVIDDGVRVYIDGDLVLDGWDYHSNELVTCNYQSKVGVKTPVRIEYADFGGSATVVMRWRSEHQELEAIPKCYLYAE